MHKNANLSHDERERLAYLSGDVLMAHALSRAGAMEAVATSAASAQTYIHEASGCFMPEDFMQPELDALAGIIRSMRKGERRDELQGLLTRMEDMRNEQAGNSEYGADELRKASQALDL